MSSKRRDCKCKERYKTVVLTFLCLIFTYTHANAHTPKVASSAGYCQSNLFLCHLVPGGHTWVHRDTHCFLKDQRHNRCDRPPPSEYLWLLPVQWLLRVFFFFLIRFWSHHRTKPLKGQMLMSLCHRMFAFFSVISWFPFFYPLIIKLTFQRTRSLKAFQISTDFWNSLCLLDFFFF